MTAPTITGIAATEGFTTGGTYVLISGTGLSSATSVTFDGVNATSFAAAGISGDDLAAVTPAHAAGAVDVVVTTPSGTGTGVGLFTYITPDNPSYTLLLWDDSCHMYISDDTGNSFTQGCTPGNASTPLPRDPGLDPHGFGTIKDAWTDGLMAINDADYQTFVGVDESYQSVYGILGISPTRGTNLSFTLVDPEPNAPAFSSGAGYQEYLRGATSANAQTILLGTVADNTSPPENFYCRISRNGGSTWSNVTGLDVNVYFSAVCFGSTASQVMYAKPSAHGTGSISPAYIRKSTDWGVTWTALTSGPDDMGAQEREGKQRLRCSADGQVVVMVSYQGFVWTSQDGGANWTNTDLLATFYPGFLHGLEGDCSVTPDGNTVVVTVTATNNITFHSAPAVFVSTNRGVTFVDRSSGIVFPFGHSGTGTGQINIAPDGLGIVHTFDSINDPGIIYPDGIRGNTMYCNVSTDAGVTWRQCSYGADPYESSSTVGTFTAAFIVPFTVPPAPSRRWMAEQGPIRI